MQNLLELTRPNHFGAVILHGMQLFWSMRIWARRDFAYSAAINWDGRGLNTTASEVAFESTSNLSL